MKNYKLVVDGNVVYDGTDRNAFLDAFETMVTGDSYTATITPVAKSLSVSGTVG